MMAEQDDDLTSPDKNEVIPSRTFTFHPRGGGGGGVATVASKVDPVLKLCDH